VPDAVAGQGGEIAEQAPEAVDGQAVGGARLGAGGLRAEGGVDGRGAGGLGGGLVALATHPDPGQLTGRTLFFSTNSPSCMLVTITVPLSKYG